MAMINATNSSCPNPIPGTCDERAPRRPSEGVLLERLIPTNGGAPSSVNIRSMTGYSRRFPIEDAPRMLLATRLNGSPLEPGHGFPVRLVVPGQRGFAWVKWVSSVEAEGVPWWWQPPFPLQ